MKYMIFLLMLITIIVPSQSYATESLDNAMFKGTNPLKEAMGKPIYANRIYQEGFHCWDPALIKVGDTYHLFYSRWRMVPGKVNDLTTGAEKYPLAKERYEYGFVACNV